VELCVNRESRGAPRNTNILGTGRLIPRTDVLGNALQNGEGLQRLLPAEPSHPVHVSIDALQKIAGGLA